MGYRGKLAEREAACELRAAGWTVPEIAAKLGVARSSVSTWVRDVPLAADRPRRIRADRPNSLRDRKRAEVARLLEDGRRRVGELSPREFLVAGAALYAGEGAKTDGRVKFTNSDPRMVLFFLAWLRRFFEIDEARLRLHLYLHEGLDLKAAMHFWSDATGIPLAQHRKPYRARAKPTVRSTKHQMGCVSVAYECSRTHRGVVGLTEALLSCMAYSGVAQLAEQAAVNR